MDGGIFIIVIAMVALYGYGILKGWKRANFIYLGVFALVLLGGFLTLTGHPPSTGPGPIPSP